MATMTNWQIVGQDSDEIPRIDIDRDRRNAQRNIYVGSRQAALALGAILIFAATVSTPTTAGYFQQRSEIAGLTHMKSAMDRRVAGLSTVSSSLESERSAWRHQNTRDAQRHDWGDLLYTIAATVPPTIYLDNLQIQGRISDSPIVLEGETRDISTIRPFVETLSLSPQVGDAKLTETTADPTDNKIPTRFRIDMVGRTPLSNQSK